ncbi:MAG: hypothetical protein ACYC5G_02915 [Candidatus Doudnabacteria bacterium]
MPERIGFDPSKEQSEGILEQPETVVTPEVQEETDNQESRRSFLKKVVGAGAYLAVGSKVEKLASAAEPETSLNNAAETEVKKLSEYPTGPLEGRKFPANSLFAHFTGISGEVPRVAKINFYDQLDTLFDKKESFAKRRRKTNTVFRQAATQLKKEYVSKDPQRTDLRAYLQTVEAAIQRVEANMDWDKLVGKLGLDKEEAALLRTISNSLDSKHLTAYALTELMPSDDGDLNRDVFSFLLKNAGSRYVYSIPAIYDDMTSFGPYQFTSYALYETSKEKRGASVVADCSKKEIIPSSVVKLRGSEHHAAAFCFSIYNLAVLLRQCSPKEKQVLKNTWRSHTTDLVEFIATAHHLPGGAIKSARRWLNNGAKLDFEVSCPRNLRQYARKTKANLRALKNV